jgi:hypothetical protein
MNNDNNNSLNTFVFRKLWWEAVQDLPDDERLLYYDLLLKFAFTRKIPHTENKVVTQILKFVIPILLSDKDKRAVITAIRQNAGKKGATARWKEPKPQELKPEQKVAIVQHTDSSYATPTLEDCVRYFAMYDVSADSANNFFNYYEAQNWMIGNSLIYNWKAKANQWIGKEKGTSTKEVKQNKQEQHQSINDRRKRNSDVV